MPLRIATYNVENLFSRPLAMADGMGAKGRQAIEDHAELNAIIARPAYADADKTRLVELARHHGFHLRNTPADALVTLNRVREQLYSVSREGVISVKANGRADWTGWFELRRGDVSWRAIYNTGRVIAATDPDVLVCVEAEDRTTLLRFNEQVLGSQFGHEYPHVMVIDGNDPRGIDVGILSRHPIVEMRSFVDDRDADGKRVFSRDCAHYTVLLPSRRKVSILANHLKSKRNGNDTASQERRRQQAARVHAIARDAERTTSLVLVAGDMNDTPDSPALADLFKDGYTDVMTHPDYPRDRPGTYETGLAGDKIDYLIMSTALRARLRTTGIERRGSYHPRTWQPFDTVTGAADEASDHHLVWADFTL